MINLSDIKYLILDMDGVLWRGELPMPALADFFHTLHQQNIPFILATNNASKTVEDYVAKLARFGVSVPAKAILTSATATASYLQTVYPAGTALYVIGENSLRQALQTHGFILTNDQTSSDGWQLVEPLPTAVVAGLTRAVTYHDLGMASLYIQRGATFYGTNGDHSYPMELGVLPGAGAILAAIEATTGVAPIVIGKPGQIMFNEALRRLGAKPEQTAMVGDRLETDILGGQNAGIHTILLLSGISQPHQLLTSPIQPNWVFPDLAALYQALQQKSPL